MSAATVKNVDMLLGINRPKKSDGKGQAKPKLSKIQDLNLAIDKRWVQAAPLPDSIDYSLKLERMFFEKVTKYKIVHLENGHQELKVIGSFKKKKTHYLLIPSQTNQVINTILTKSNSIPLTELEKVKYNQVDIVDVIDSSKQISTLKPTSNILLEKIDLTIDIESPMKISSELLTSGTWSNCPS